MKLSIYDTTLRDGMQNEGISFSFEDKLNIAKKLDEIGVDYIEFGKPGSDPQDAEYFQRLNNFYLNHAKIAALGSTCGMGLNPESDPKLQALLKANVQVCALVGKTWPLHIIEVLQTDLQENLRIISESVRYLVAQNKEVIYDAEHFFDGYKADRDYAIRTLKEALKSGANCLVLCDTNGGTLPHEVSAIVKDVAESFPGVAIGIHCHNDCGCAVANSLAAVQAGVVHVQGTINGYGERTGNANLCSVIPTLELKLGYTCLPAGNLSRLYDLSHTVADIAKRPLDENQPYVGANAFMHKAKTHVAAMERSTVSYQHIDPALVGNRTRIVK